MFETIKHVWATVDFQPFYGKIGGRSFILIVFFALTAFWLAKHGLLTGAYAAVISTLSGWHCGRAIMQDYHNRKMQGK